AVARCSALDTTVFRLRYPRKFEGTYFASQAECVPAHAEISGNVPDAVNVKMQLPADAPDLAPVFCVVTLIMPLSATLSMLTYVVVKVEQPAWSASVGHAFLVDTYSLIDVLHAAMAATPSDIF